MGRKPEPKLRGDEQKRRRGRRGLRRVALGLQSRFRQVPQVDDALVQRKFTSLLISGAPYSGRSASVPVSKHPRLKGGATGVTRLVRAEVSRGRSTDSPQTSGNGKDQTFLDKEEPSMNSNRPKHTEPTSGNHQGAEESKGPCSSASFTGHSDSAPIEKPALNSVPLNLMEQIVDPDNLECAWARVKANRGAPGPDGITIDQFPEHFREQWPVLRQQLLEGTYKPGPVRRKSIPKSDGGERHLGIPNVVDRLVQQASGSLKPEG